MKVPFHGGCHCGCVRYECRAEPRFMINCHCRQCQQLSGAPYVSVFNVSATALRVTGEIRTTVKIGGSGQDVENDACAHCGGRLFSRPKSMPGVVNVFAASLDDPSWFRPAANIFAAGALPWDVMDPAIPRFETLPPARSD